MAFQDEFGESIMDIRSIQEVKQSILDGDDVFGNAEDQVDYLRKVHELETELGDTLDDYSGDPTMIHEDYFEEYAEQLADDIGAIDANASWPINHIDWTAAADELKMDYLAVSVGPHTYYVR